MEFKDLAEKRYSHRGYSRKNVENETLDYILETMLLAPSAANRQPYRVHIVRSEKLQKKIVEECYRRDWLEEAPIIAVFTSVSGESWRRGDGADYVMYDVALAADYFTLAAADAGLGTCLIASFDEAKLAEILSLPAGEKAIIMTPLGYPKGGSSRERVRKKIQDMTRFI